MSSKPSLSQACNTQSCEQIFGCSLSGCYGYKFYHAVYYHYEDDNGRGRLNSLVFQGAHVVWGNSRLYVRTSNISCNGVRQTGKTWGKLDCTPAAAEIGPYNIGGWLYTVYGNCGGSCWHNGTKWTQYGAMNIKRKPA